MLRTISRSSILSTTHQSLRVSYTISETKIEAKDESDSTEDESDSTDYQQGTGNEEIIGLAGITGMLAAL